MKKSINHSRRSCLKILGLASLGSHLATATAQTSTTLRLLNAKSYIATETLDNFQQQNDYSITMDTYRSQADLISLLLSRLPKYDVVIIPSFLANRFHSAQLLSPLMHEKIPNIKHLDPQFMQTDFDPMRRFSLPYLWSIMGVAYRKTAVRGELTSWQTLFDSKRYSTHIALHSNAKLLFKCALKYIGHQGPTTARALKEAEKLLLKQKPHIHFLSNSAMQKALLQHQYHVAMGWNGYILQNMKQDKNIRYMNPKEGSIIWEDCLCIPRRAPNQVAAHDFINFVLEPTVAAAIAQQTRYATPNKTALTHLPKSYTQNTAIFPRTEILRQSETLFDEGHYIQQLYQASFRRVMGG